MRITKVYTKTGDQGATGLADGSRVEKDHPRIEAYGSVDELSAVIGLARCRASQQRSEAALRLDGMLHTVQNHLFEVGAALATPPSPERAPNPRFHDGIVETLETWIDELNEDLPPLTEFILPGGGLLGASLHQARTVCRRAERMLIPLLREEPEATALSLRYLNRLSDLLFVQARWVAQALNEPEVLWDRS